MARAIHILNGPNLNLLGTREAEIYGHDTLDDIRTACETRAKAHDAALTFRQTNQEGELVEHIHEAEGGIIINAGAYTHTSIAVFDALTAVGLPVIEVHLSNIFAREEFRSHSYISPAARGVICGLGMQGYLVAIDALAEAA